MTPQRAAALRPGGAAHAQGAAHADGGAQVDQAHASLHDHLVAKTGELLGDVSLGALTTRQIARHAGVSDGVLYNHFADKSELIIASLLDRYVRLLETFETRAPRVGEGTVEANLRAFARALSTLEAEVLLLGAGLLADPALLARFWTEIHRSPFGPERLMEPLRAYLHGERAAGRVSSSLDVNAATTLVFGASAMVALTRRLSPQAAGSRLDAQLDAAITTLIRGLEA
jgi:AcrR family transcriptional regulator